MMLLSSFLVFYLFVSSNFGDINRKWTLWWLVAMKVSLYRGRKEKLDTSPGSV
jgi:hypothetical protein